MLEDHKHECRNAFNTVAIVGKQSKAKLLSPISLRLTVAEREQLEIDAAGRTLSSYIRWRLFRDRLREKHPNRRPKRKSHRPHVDHILLAQLLGMLGQSRLSSNLNQIAKAANIGALPVTDELSDELHLACGDVREMRDTLMRALGRTKV